MHASEWDFDNALHLSLWLSLHFLGYPSGAMETLFSRALESLLPSPAQLHRAIIVLVHCSAEFFDGAIDPSMMRGISYRKTDLCWQHIEDNSRCHGANLLEEKIMGLSIFSVNMPSRGEILSLFVRAWRLAADAATV